MTQYKQCKKLDGSANDAQVIRIEDGLVVPNDLANTDWIEYLSWLAAGNSPLPPDGK